MVLKFLILLFSLYSVNAVNIHENSNACVDSCGSVFESYMSIDLSNDSLTTRSNENDLIEIVDQSHNTSDSCSKNVLLRIPISKLERDTIIKLELDYANQIEGATLHISDVSSDDSFGSSLYNTEIFMENSKLEILKPINSCDSNSTKTALDSKEDYLKTNRKVVIYISNAWIRVENMNDKSKPKLFHDEEIFQLFKSKCEQNLTTEKYLYIGLNRLLNDLDGGIGRGVCQASISFLNCYSKDESEMDIDIEKMDYKLNEDENETIEWIHKLDYFQPGLENLACSGEGVFKVKFDPNSPRKIARFDMSFGEIVSGFTFNIGDSPTNNAYGGDDGSTSNSAEIHSNDNRFYVWVNPKYCGDTLLHAIQYDVFRAFDNVTIFISDQRIEINNKRDYHETFLNPYFYNLNGQNVSCNCYDTRCYPGVESDNDLYIGLNRVIGGTFRPGVGLCNLKMSWLQCKAIKKPVEITDDKTAEFESAEENEFTTNTNQLATEIVYTELVEDATIETDVLQLNITQTTVYVDETVLNTTTQVYSELLDDDNITTTTTVILSTTTVTAATATTRITTIDETANNSTTSLPSP